MDQHTSTRRGFLSATGTAAAVATAGCLGALEDDASGESDRYTTPAANAFDGVVDVQWLEEHRNDVALLDVRDEQAVTDTRIDGAHRLSETIHDNYEETDDGPETSLEDVASVLENAGLSPTDDVVVYGSETTMWATHGVYTLEAVGHEGDVTLLDGGLSAWREADGETESGSIDAVDDPATYDPELDTTVLATREDVADHVHEGGADLPIVDLRTLEEYLGADDADDRVSRHGHIAGAMNLPFPQNFVGDGERLRSPDDLEELWLEAADLEPDEPTITYCVTGVRGSVGWFVLRQLGWDDVRNYDGSWLDWGTLSDDDGYYYASDEPSGRVVDTFT